MRALFSFLLLFSINYGVWGLQNAHALTQAPGLNCVFGESAYPGLRRTDNDEVKDFQKARGILIGRTTDADSTPKFKALAQSYQDLALALVRSVFEEPLASESSVLRYALSTGGFSFQELELRSSPGRRFIYVAFYPGDNEYGWILGSIEKSIVFSDEPGLEIVARVNDGDIYDCKVLFKP